MNRKRNYNIRNQTLTTSGESINQNILENNNHPDLTRQNTEHDGENSITEEIRAEVDQNMEMMHDEDIGNGQPDDHISTESESEEFEPKKKKRKIQDRNETTAEDSALKWTITGRIKGRLLQAGFDIFRQMLVAILDEEEAVDHHRILIIRAETKLENRTFAECRDELCPGDLIEALVVDVRANEKQYPLIRQMRILNKSRVVIGDTIYYPKDLCFCPFTNRVVKLPKKFMRKLIKFADQNHIRAKQAVTIKAVNFGGGSRYNFDDQIFVPADIQADLKLPCQLKRIHNGDKIPAWVGIACSPLQGGMVSRLRSDDEEGWDVLIRAFKLFVTMTLCKADAESGKAKLMLKPKTVFVNTKDDLASISFEVESVTEYQIKEKPDGKIRTSVLMQFYSDGSYSTIRAMVTETGMVEQVEWSPASGFVAVITQGIQETAREKAILTLNGSWSKIKTKLAVNSTEQLKECMVKIEPAIKIVQVIYLIRHLKKSRLFKAEYRQKVADIIETLLYREMSKCNQEKPVKELMEMAPKDLLPEQEEVIRTVLKGNFRVFEIQGVAGSGKTFTICELIKLEFLRMQAEWQAQDDADDDDDLEEQLGDEIAELEEIRQLAAKDDQVLTPEELAQIRQARVQAFSILDARFAKKMGKFGGIPLLVAVTNAAVLTLVEKLLTMTVPPLCLLSLSATTMARRKNAAIIEMCSIEAHCQRLLRAKQLSTAEQFILQDAIAIQEKLERKTKKIVAENDFDQIDPTEEDDMLDFDWENLENETEKPETMASAEKKSAEGSDQETLQWH